MLSVARLVSFWRCIPVQYNCQKSSNFQGLSHFSRIFGKNDKIPGFFQAGKTVTIFPGFPGAVGTLVTEPEDAGENKRYVCHVIPLFTSRYNTGVFQLLRRKLSNIPDSTSHHRCRFPLHKHELCLT